MVTAGTIDTSFIIGSGFINDYNDCLVYITKLQPDGKILVGGQFSSYNGTEAYNLIRLNSDGSVDNTFNNGPYFPTYGKVNAIELDSDGNILVGGYNLDNFNGTPLGNIVKLNSDGNVISTFNSGFDNTVRDIKIQLDGKIIVVGSFGKYAGVPISSTNIVRINTDTTLDTTFNSVSGFDNQAFSIVFENNGNILVGGEFSTYNGINANDLVRLDSNGSLLSTFGNGFDGRVQKVVLQPDGKILCGGQFNYYNGTYSQYMIRLKANGSVDTTFEFDDYVIDMLVQADGRIVVGGKFNNYVDPILGNVVVNYITRLNPSGSIDGSFYPFIVDEGFDDQVNSITELPNGNILVGGWFTQYTPSTIGGDYYRLISLNNDESTYQYQYVYSATSCDQSNFGPIILNRPTYYIGSDVELLSGDTVSIYDINNPSFVQCATILSDTNIAEVPTHVYTTTYDDCETCFSANSVIALVKPCSDDEGYVPPIVVSNLYNVGDIFSIPNTIYSGEGEFVGLFNDCFKIVEIVPYESDSYLSLPYIVEYQPKESCEQCTNCIGRYYEYQDCVNGDEGGIVFSRQTMVDGNSFLFQSGTSFCKEVIDYQYFYGISLSDYQTYFTGSPLVNSTVIYNDCDTCLNNVNYNFNWLQSTSGNSATIDLGTDLITFVGPSDDNDSGWSYIYGQALTNGTLTINWDWSTNDAGGEFDWGFYYVGSNEPDGGGNINFDFTTLGQGTSASTGTTTIIFSAGDWVSIGVYSSDGEAGPGLLIIDNPAPKNSYDLHSFTTCDGQEGYINIPKSAELKPNLTIVENGDFDDDYFPINLPIGFNINFLGVNYDEVFIGSNAYLTFGDGSSAHNFEIPGDLTYVGLPGVYVSTYASDPGVCMDSIMWILYTGFTDNGNTFIIRFEGNDDYSTNQGDTNLVYNFKFYKNESNYFDLVIEQNEFFCNDDPTGGLADGNNNSWLDTFNSSSENAYRITDTDSVMSVTGITYEPVLNYGVVKGNVGNTPAVCGTIGSIVNEATFGSNGYPGSLYFDGNPGSNVTVDYNLDMDLNYGSWTIEWFQYYTSPNACCLRVFDIGSFGQEQVGASIESGSIFVWLKNGDITSSSPYTFTLNTPVNNVWTHIAITAEDNGYPNRTLRVFQDGVILPETYTITMDLDNFDGSGNLPLTIGSMGNGNNPFEGYITNFRWNKGTCYYTGNFTVPTSPLTVDGSQLLLLAESVLAPYLDSSGTQVVNGNVVWSSKNPWEVTSPTAGIFYSDATTTYESCNDCSQMYGATIKECTTGKIKYVTMTESTINNILSQGPIFGTRAPECYEMLDYCIVPYESMYIPTFFYSSCEICNQPFSANTESLTCVICCDCGATGSTINQVSPPHPIWTNEYGKSVVQMNMTTLGGMNGLNA